MDTTLLQQIVHNTDLKQGFSILVSRNDSRIFTLFNPLPQLQFKESNTTLGFKRQLYTFDRATNVTKRVKTLLASEASTASWWTVASSIAATYTAPNSPLSEASPPCNRFRGKDHSNPQKIWCSYPWSWEPSIACRHTSPIQTAIPHNLRREHLTIRFHLREAWINSLLKYGLNFIKGQSKYYREQTKKVSRSPFVYPTQTCMVNTRCCLPRDRLKRSPSFYKMVLVEKSTNQLKKNIQKESGFLSMLAERAMRAFPMLANTIHVSMRCWSPKLSVWNSDQQCIWTWILHQKGWLCELCEGVW